MLNVENISVTIGGKTLLNKTSFHLKEGEVLCVVGESGAGKSTLLKGLQGLMPAECERFSFAPEDCQPTNRLPTSNAPGLPHTRWVMQDPLAALNPRRSIGASIAESLFESGMSADAKRQAVHDALVEVELDPNFYDRRPGQLSQGQAQRVCLARALVARPKLVIFDEPLSALDALVQKKIAYKMDQLRQELGTTYLYVTHDLGFAEAYSDNILVLHQGNVADYQPTKSFFAAPAQPYAANLVAAARSLGTLAEQEVTT